MAQSHAMPAELKRLGKGEYEVRGTELRIVQGDEGKWTVTGHSDDLGAFGSRGAALGKLLELGLVSVPGDEPSDEPPGIESAVGQPKPEPKVTETTQGVGGRGGKAPKATTRRPRTRKPEAAKATA
jgi:hypothetical protein